MFEKSWFSTIDVFFNEVLEKAFQFFSVAVSARKHFEGLKTTRTEVLRPHDLDGPTLAHAILASKELIVRLS